MIGRIWIIYRIAILDFFFQAEDGIRDAQESRGLGDVYKRQAFEERPAAVLEHRVDLGLAPVDAIPRPCVADSGISRRAPGVEHPPSPVGKPLDVGGGDVAVCAFPRLWVDQAGDCLLYTSDAADELLCVDLGGRRNIQKKTTAI